jgi:cell fate regulator YaaT (PSP1 superfamily)
MRYARVQFVTWDKDYIFDPAGLDLKVGSKVIVKTDQGTELGEVIGFVESESQRVQKIENATETENKESTEIKPIVRLATSGDIERTISLAEKTRTLDYAKSMKERLNLPMKFIDVHFSYDGSRIVFAFIADGRVDFRDLVKDLTRNFGKTIRLQQIGIRDEAKIMGDMGHCGKGLCCKGHLKDLASITSEMAELQQCSHRGSERISGVCGRLMCCLAYEQEGYEESAKKLPAMGIKVSVDGKRGVVVGHHILKQSVDVKFNEKEGGGSGSTVMEVDLNRNKKK